MKSNGKPLFYIEEKHYSLEKLNENFDENYLELLKSRKICMEVQNGSKVKFTFVGLLIYYEKVVCILPKYTKENDEQSFEKKMRTILRVIRKYNKKFKSTLDSINFSSVSSLNDSYSNNFAIAGFILEDYSSHGLYSRTVKQLESNGSGEINWDQTVNEVDPFLIRGAPYYLDYVTNNEFVDEKNIVMRVHEWVVAHFSSLFGEWLGFGNLRIHLKNPKLKSIGTREYLIAELTKELNETFIDRKINLIKALIIIVQNEFDLSSKQLNIYGVRSYEVIWEEACRSIFADELDHFVEMIPAPLWMNNETKLSVEKDTFIPDIIKTYSVNGEEYFAVLDAKYYNFRFTTNNVLGNPSVNDVAKQLLYQKAFSEIKSKKMRNYFLFPRDEHSRGLINVVGKVSLDFINPNPVTLVYLFTDMVYNMYLNNDILKEEEYRELEFQTSQTSIWTEK